MLTVSHSFRSTASPEVTFGLLTNFERRPEWLDIQSAARSSIGAVAVGTTFHEVNRILGREKEVRFEVTDVVDQRRLVYESVDAGMFSARVSWAVTPDEGGSTVGVDVELRLHGLGRFFGLFGSGPLRRHVRTDIESLAELLEQ